jgi:hypothetical protein
MTYAPDKILDAAYQQDSLPGGNYNTPCFSNKGIKICDSNKIRKNLEYDFFARAL